MLIKLLRNTVADGLPVSAGQVVDVSDGAGKALVLMGKASLVAVADTPEAVDEPIETVNTAGPIEPAAEVVESVAPARPRGRQAKR